MLPALLLLICLRPFISSLAYPFADFIFSFFSIIILLACLLARKNNLCLNKSVKWPLISFLLFLLISAAFSFNKLTSLREAYKYLCAILFFLVATTFSEKEGKCFLFCVVATGAAIGLLAFYQYFFGLRHTLDFMLKNRMGDDFTLEYLTRKRAFFPFVTPGALGGYLAMIIPLVFTLKKNLWGISALIVFALLLTKSLGAILSLFLALVIYLLLVKIPKGKILVFAAGLFIILAGIFIIRSSAQKTHLQPAFSALMRISYWQQTWQIIQQAPLLGLGPGNFTLAQSRYAHNSYLQLWAETGIFGLLSFCWLLWAVLSSAIKKLRNPAPPLKNETLLLITACLVFLLHNLMDFTFFLPEVSLTWWVITGCLHSRGY